LIFFLVFFLPIFRFLLLSTHDFQIGNLEDESEGARCGVGEGGGRVERPAQPEWSWSAAECRQASGSHGGSHREPAYPAGQPLFRRRRRRRRRRSITGERNSGAGCAGSEGVELCGEVELCSRWRTFLATPHLHCQMYTPLPPPLFFSPSPPSLLFTCIFCWNPG